MATCPEGDQVLFLSGMAAEFFVVNLQIGYATARLAAPVITSQHLLLQSFVRRGIVSQSWSFWTISLTRLPLRWFSRTLVSGRV